MLGDIETSNYQNSDVLSQRYLLDANENVLVSQEERSSLTTNLNVSQNVSHNLGNSSEVENSFNTAIDDTQTAPISN